MVGDARQHVAQVRLWIQAVQLCRFDEAVKGCRPVGAPLRAGEEVVLAPIRYTPTFVLARDGREVGRIEGYPGDSFFWALLDKLESYLYP